MGIPPEAFADDTDDEDDQVIELLADLKHVVDLATAGAGRLSYAGMGGVVTGFDLVAIDVLAQWMGISIDRQMAADLMVISDECVRIFAEART